MRSELRRQERRSSARGAPKTAISVTLDADNLLWPRGRARAAGLRSLSETLDRLVGAARTQGRAPDGGGRSVVGTIDIDPADPALENADRYVRSLIVGTIGPPV